MQIKSTTGRYGVVAMTIHWITAFAVIGLLVSGNVAEDMSDDAVRISILRIHATMGFLIFLLTLMRIAWWVFADDRPAPVPGLPTWQKRASQLAHYALYALVIVMGTSGIATILLSGAFPVLFSSDLGPLPAFRDLAPRSVHGVVSSLLILFAAIHVAAALYHQFIRHDRLLARMGIGKAI